jgi:hypothetical protein
MNFINTSIVKTNQINVDIIPSDVFLAFEKIKSLMEARIHGIYPETMNSMSLEDKQVCNSFLAGQLQYANEELKRQLESLSDPISSSSEETTSKRAHVVTPDMGTNKADDSWDIEFASYWLGKN